MTQKNQLFKKIPTRELVERVLNLYGVKEFKDNSKITLNQIEKLKTIENLNNMVPELRDYYINCKANKYLIDIDPKRAITVLRQLLKTQRYTLGSKEKYAEGKKYLEYKVNTLQKKNRSKKKIVVTFD